MSGQRAAAEPYTTRFETEVTAVDGRRVWLETTYFFAGVGGQPADRGTVGDVPLEDVRLEDGEHVHVLAEEPSFGAGRRVLCSVDWTYRMYCMRAHTACHVLDGAARRCFEDVTCAGIAIGDDRVRVDLETSRPVDDRALVELDRRLNRVVWESRPVTWETISLEEARSQDRLAGVDAEEGAVSSGRVRVVTVGASDEPPSGRADDPWNVAACGGTHVRTTREIGPVTVVRRLASTGSACRLELAVGSRAIERRALEKRATLAAERALGVSTEDVPEAVETLQAEQVAHNE